MSLVTKLIIYRVTVTAPPAGNSITSAQPGNVTAVDIYRVFSKGRIDIGPPKSLIFQTFPGVLGFF